MELYLRRSGVFSVDFGSRVCERIYRRADIMLPCANLGPGRRDFHFVARVRRQSYNCKAAVKRLAGGLVRKFSVPRAERAPGEAERRETSGHITGTTGCARKAAYRHVSYAGARMSRTYIVFATTLRSL